MIVPVATGTGFAVGDGEGATVGDGLGDALGVGLAGTFVLAVVVEPQAAAKRAAATRAPRKTGLGNMR
jgi:hypothetical protein